VLQSQFASRFLFLIPFMPFSIIFCFAYISLLTRLLLLLFMLPVSLFLSSPPKRCLHFCLAVFAVSSSFVSYMFPPFPMFYAWLLDTGFLILDPVPQLASLLTEWVRFLRSLVLAKLGARQFLSDIYPCSLNSLSSLSVLLISFWYLSGWHAFLVPFRFLTSSASSGEGHQDGQELGHIVCDERLREQHLLILERRGLQGDPTAAPLCLQRGH